MIEPDKRTQLLPQAFTRPSFIIWVMILPQLLLLFLNLSAWDLARGEMSPQQRGMALTIFVYEIGLLLIGLTGLGVLLRLKRGIGAWFCAGMLLLHIGYLWMVTGWIDELLPQTITLWMLSQPQALHYQYALMMPALFFAGLRLSCFQVRLPKGKDIGITLGALILVPVAWYILLQLSSSLWRWVEPPFAVMLILIIGCTVIMLVAFLRILMYLYKWLRRSEKAWFILPAFAGLAFIGGLVLNSTIEFPYDFQHTYVYILAVANLAVLLLPFRTGTGLGTLGWVLRAVMFPFTLYFFIVFLPFLPLSLLAMIFFGAGVLILSPTLLFVIHTSKLVDEGRHLAGQVGFPKVIALFIICFLLIPAAYTGRALMDKHGLQQAMDAVYSPDYQEGTLDINLSSARRSLRRLRQSKAGVTVPFVSDYYDQLVFGGMVLPDHKMERIYRLLFAEELPSEDSGGFGSFFSRGRGGWRGRPPRVRLPERNVDLVPIKVDRAVEGDIARTTVTIEMKNKGSGDSELVTTMHLPDGVLISGYWLDVLGERVPGSIFERKAAMWVYHMIRDTVRRDPGLLVYKSDNRVKLSVFPFARDEVRTTGIEFMFPAGMKPEVRIGDRTVRLAAPGGQEADRIFHVEAGSTQFLIVPRLAASRLPPVSRRPYFHFIVDPSEAAQGAFSAVSARLMEHFPGTTRCRITLANYEYQHLTSSLIPITGAENTLKAGSLFPLRGAFCPEIAMKGALLAYRDSPPFDDDGAPMVPIFVIVESEGTEMIPVEDLSYFGRIVPDADSYYTAGKGAILERHSFDPGPAEQVTAPDMPYPSLVFRCGKAIGLCRADTGGKVVLEGAKPGEIEVYDHYCPVKLF